jgi:hypothetical protein
MEQRLCSEQFPPWSNYDAKRGQGYHPDADSGFRHPAMTVQALVELGNVPALQRRRLLATYGY